MDYEEELQDIKKEVSNVTFHVNKYKKVQHKLTLTEPTLALREYQFFDSSTLEGYYQWGAQKWFYEDQASYPTKNDEEQSAYDPPLGSWRGYDNIMASGSAVDYLSVNYQWYQNNVHWTTRNRHRQSQKNDMWKYRALTANQMSYYVVYGDPHLDFETEWILVGYNGAYTICNGGVWLKKKEYICSDNGVTWPGYDDGSQFGNLCAPFPNYDTQVGFSTEDWQTERLYQQEGQQYNLRYYAPADNFRVPYTREGKPDASVIDHYFFVPCLGRYEYDHIRPGETSASNVPTLTLVGAQGFYWTKTPLMYDASNNKYYYGNGNGYDNAFYLNIHYNYLALSWQQRSIYLHTGMRVATTDLFE